MTAPAEIAVNLFAGRTHHPHAWRFFRDPSRFCLALAGRRGAKSYTGRDKFLDRIFSWDWPKYENQPYAPGAAKRNTALWWDRRPRLHYWVVAEVAALLDEPKRYILQALPPELLEHSDGSKNRLWLKGDILIEFKTAHNPELLVGSGLNGMWIEEAARLRPDTWGLYLLPTLADKTGWMIATTTPMGNDWTLEAIETPAKKGIPGHGFHAWKSTDNVRCPDVIQNAEAARLVLPEEYWQREFGASREAFMGQIYKRQPSTFAKLPEGMQFRQIIGGVDWGFAKPGALLTCGVGLGDKPHYWFLDEVYSESELVEDFWAPKALELGKGRKFNDWVCDPAEPDNLTRLRNCGLRARKHQNYSAETSWDEHARSIRDGIRTMSAALHQNRVHVSESCANLISEFKSYAWEMSRGQQLEHPKRGQPDHAVTVARYIVSSIERGPQFQELKAA